MPCMCHPFASISFFTIVGREVEPTETRLLLDALEDLLKDPTFQTGAQVACESRKAAEILSK